MIFNISVMIKLAAGFPERAKIIRDVQNDLESVGWGESTQVAEGSHWATMHYTLEFADAAQETDV